MLLEAALSLQSHIEQKTFRDSIKSICDPDKKFIEAESKEDKHTRELFEKLLETMERESWRNREFRHPN